VRRAFVGGVLFFVLAFGLGGHSFAASCSGAEAFSGADELFTQAEEAKDSETAQKLWEDGTALLSAHRDDSAPSSCRRDDYQMTRLVAFVHGIRVGYKWAGMTLSQAVKTIDDFQRAAFQALGPPNPIIAFSSEARALEIRSFHYQEALKILLHHPDGPNCADPNVDTDVLNPITPEYPESAKGIDANVRTVKVLVSVDANGKVTGTSVQQTSMVPVLDTASLLAARASTYLPKIQNCAAVAGTYLFEVTFDPNA